MSKDVYRNHEDAVAAAAMAFDVDITEEDWCHYSTREAK